MKETRGSRVKSKWQGGEDVLPAGGEGGALAPAAAGEGGGGAQVEGGAGEGGGGLGGRPSWPYQVHTKLAIPGALRR